MLKLTATRLAFVRAAALVCAFFSVAGALHAQSFLQPSVLPTGNWPAAIYTADVNGDGIPDLIYIDHGATPAASTTHMLVNDGKGNFTPYATIATAGDSVAYAPSGIAGSGMPTLVWLSSDASGFTIHRASNCGSANTCATLLASPPIAYPYANANPPQLHYVSTGKLAPLTGANQYSTQLLFEDSANQLLYSVLFNPDGTTVLQSAALPDGAGPLLVVPGLATSASVSLVVTGLTNRTAQVFNRGLSLAESNLPITQPSTRIANVHSLLLQDVDLDGKPDLIAEGLNGHIDVYPGNGDGTFSTTSIGGTGPLDGLTGNGGHLIAIADLNHDGQLDALTATPAGISTLFGAGTSYLKLGGIYNSGPGHTSYAVADFNGDGNLDLAVDSPEGIAILYGNADGSFQTSRAFAAGQPALSGTLATFTPSGHLDAVVSTAATQGQVLFGAGDGTFLYSGAPGAPAPTTSQTGTPGLWSTVQAADFNGDGNVDLLFTADGSNASLPAAGSNSSQAVGANLQRGQGNGLFGDPSPAKAAAQFTYPSPGSCSPAFDHFPGLFFGTSVTADFTQDGLADFANRDAAAYRILRGNTNPPGGPANVNPTLFWSGVDGYNNSMVDCNAHAHELVATADFNHDGFPDLLYQGNHQDTGALLLYLSDSSGALTLAGDLSVNGSLNTAGQLNAPNLSNVFGGISTTLNGPYFIGSIATADLDRDGNTDLLVTYANLAADPTSPASATPNYLYIWYGSGSGKFLTSPAHPTNPVRIPLSRNYYQVSVLDLNNDGIPDLVLSDGLLVSYQLGLGDGTFGPEHHLLAGRGINTVSTADLRGLKTQDLVIANGGAALANPVVNHEALAADPDVNTGGITVLLNTVTPKATAATLTVSPEPSVFYSAYTLTASSPVQIASVTFSQDGVVLATVSTTNGTATYTVPTANEYAPGQHNLTASFVGVNSNVAVQATATHTILRAPTSITLMPTTPYTVYYGQGIDGIFNVTFVDGNFPDTGNYTLLDNGTAVAICTNIPVQQSCPYGNPTLLDAGKHTFSLMYLGDTYNAPSTSPDYPFTILPDLTSLIVGTSAIPAYLGQTITLTAAASGNFAIPTGTVTFSDGGQLNQTGVLSGGIAKIAVSGLSLGNHTINASMAGSVDFNLATAPPIIQQVVADLTTISLTSSKNPANKGDAVTFTVAVTGNYLPPDSAVNLLDGTNVLFSGNLTQGPGNVSTFTFTTSSLAVGTHPITAVYLGDASFNPATSAVLSEIIQAPPVAPQASITTLSSNLNPSAPQQLVTFTAYVQVPGVFIGVPAGTVTFLDGATVLGTGTLDNFGLATLQISTLATGTHQITASYAGVASTTAPILPSTSQPLAQVVALPLISATPGFLMTATPNAMSLATGRTGVVTVTITPVGGFNQPVALTCANLAPETTCIFLPAIVPAGGGTANLQLLISAPRDCNSNSPYGRSDNSTPAWPLAPGAIAAASLAFFAIRRRRIRLLQGLFLTVFAAALVSLAGCGHCTDLGTKPGNYAFQLIGTAQRTPVTQTRTLTIPLTVTIP